MPNWASVTYECVGDPKDIRLLHDALKYIDKRKTTIVPNGLVKCGLEIWSLNSAATGCNIPAVAILQAIHSRMRPR